MGLSVYGDLDPSGATYAFAKSARVYGYNIWTYCGVWMAQRPDGSGLTPKGQINAEQVVNCGGLEVRIRHMSGYICRFNPGTPLFDHRGWLKFSTHDKSGEAGRLPAGIDYEANIFPAGTSGHVAWHL